MYNRYKPGHITIIIIIIIRLNILDQRCNFYSSTSWLYYQGGCRQDSYLRPSDYQLVILLERLPLVLLQQHQLVICQGGCRQRPPSQRPLAGYKLQLGRLPLVQRPPSQIPIQGAGNMQHRTGMPSISATWTHNRTPYRRQADWITPECSLDSVQAQR